ncbi:MAG: MBL fold metallo-hydrolase [Veillonella sp.]|uniref:MBL fold metallo-hydrolase n=1 Tax=Veillonella sp. TaxID=1926307 RepID=UPI0025E30CA2|nr:MBL fold metallo-hydrolase [Veillonella sp.]MBS4912684.1 MBL fold metallo-hydrolase [Veillonella sp.]
MEIIKQPLGLYKANCYVLAEDNKALVIDPGFHAHRVLEMIGDRTLLAILLTHGHCDHICAVDGVKAAFDVPVYMHEGDRELLQLKRRMPSAYKKLCNSPIEPITEGPLNIGPFHLQVFEMPGHSKGGVMYQWGQHLFTGDTLLKNSVGAVTNYNGNQEELDNTLRRLMTWDKNLIVHPGHAEDTTIGEEMAHNPFLLKLMDKAV